MLWGLLAPHPQLGLEGTLGFYGPVSLGLGHTASPGACRPAPPPSPQKALITGAAPFSDASHWACRCICLLPVRGNPPLLDARSLKGLRSCLQALFSGPGSLDSTAGVSQQGRVERRGSGRMKGPPFLLWYSKLDQGPITPPHSPNSVFPNNAASDSSALGNNGQVDPALRNLCLQKSPWTS